MNKNNWLNMLKSAPTNAFRAILIVAGIVCSAIAHAAPISPRLKADAGR